MFYYCFCCWIKINRRNFNFSVFVFFASTFSVIWYMMMMMMVMMMMMMNCFKVWLTDKMHSTLLPARTIVRDSHHRESLTRRKQGFNLCRTRVRLSWMKLYSSDNHYTKMKPFASSKRSLNKSLILDLLSSNWLIGSFFLN